MTYELLSSILKIPIEDIVNKYKSTKTASFRPRKIAGNLSFKQLVELETHKFALPGISVHAENIRNYPYGNLLCHVLGYVGEISQGQLKEKKYKDNLPGDIIGKTGIEATFEHRLNGTDGYRWVEVDATGRIGRTLKDPPPVLSKSGEEIQLTIDLDLQIAVESYLDSWRGSIIVLDTNKGNVLAMTSRPGFDPNWFSSGISSKNWTLLNSDPNHPLYNRSIQLATSPGSVFKAITAVSGIRNKTLTQETSHFCNGAYNHFGNTFRCWKRGGHGTVSLTSALEGSCNVFFYQEGLKSGIDSISETARLFGFGTKTGIQLPNESKGFMPDRVWKKKIKKDEWWPGETISISIGQGGVIVTPIQLVNMMAAIGNRGYLYRPNLIHKVISKTSSDQWDSESKLLARISLEDSHWDILIEGLEGVVQGRSGTARKIKMMEMNIAGKTGTAQVISSDALRKLNYPPGEVPERYLDHNWFAGFAPAENPQVAVLVFIENGGKEGARSKALIARKVLMKWYELYAPGRLGPERTFE